MEIGKVLRASTQGFTCGTRSAEISGPSFGAFVLTRDIDSAQNNFLVGVITAIRIDDDPLVRQLIMASDMNPMALRDQRENRMVPVEIDVLNVGFVHNDKPIHTLPPRPPMSLDSVSLCSAEQIAFFTDPDQNPDLPFIRLILNATGVPNTIELLAAVIQHASAAHKPETRENFKILAGRRIAQLLSNDPIALQYILTLIQFA
ncbi:MAG: hypothetical protein CUN55_08735 [Phototrophicales bacterium]|nr:MAG: hypothetical protein CUN55_08735 [Phototrophicales bacterium]